MSTEVDEILRLRCTPLRMTSWMRYLEQRFQDDKVDEILTTPLHSAQDDAGRSRMAKADEILTTSLRSAQDDNISQNDIIGGFHHWIAFAIQ